MNSEIWLQKIIAPETNVGVERFGLSRVSSDWKLDNRRVREHYLTYVLHESNLVGIDGKHWSLGPGCLVYLCPQYPHSMQPATPQTPHTFYHLRFESSCSSEVLHPDISWSILRNGDYLLPLMEQMYSEYHSENIFSSIRFKCLLASVLAAVFRGTGMPAAAETGILIPYRQRKCLDYVSRNIHRSIQPRELAELTGYSTDYFSRIFRQTIGISPRSWIMRQRIKQAIFLLDDSKLNIGEIAREVGYTDVYRFSKQFKQVTGACPSSYRKKVIKSR